MVDFGLFWPKIMQVYISGTAHKGFFKNFVA